jgi:hypothetical protein
MQVLQVRKVQDVSPNKYAAGRVSGGTTEGKDTVTDSASIEADSSTNKAVAEQPITEVEDLRGEFVRVGDTIAYAVTAGRSGAMRVGEVIEILSEHHVSESYGWTRSVPTKLRVEVNASSSYGKPAKPVLIEAGLKRFVKVGA